MTVISLSAEKPALKQVYHFIFFKLPVHWYKEKTAFLFPPRKKKCPWLRSGPPWASILQHRHKWLQRKLQFETFQSWPRLQCTKARLLAAQTNSWHSWCRRSSWLGTDTTLKKNSPQILSWNQNKNSRADWSVCNLRGKTIKTKTQALIGQFVICAGKQLKQRTHLRPHLSMTYQPMKYEGISTAELIKKPKCELTPKSAE